MSDKAKQEVSGDQFSEAETDDEFGLPEFKEHFADTLKPAVLRDWTAKDFASIYVRFRPHLERHARRFLVNPSQVEEVVQDAFLYLMTTLPELDSELGVLKFLKWKVRLLSIDVLRAEGRISSVALDEVDHHHFPSPDLSRGIEQADDAAVVALALARLNPRHREALIATLYEEKPISSVASQMGLSENAFRQLLFRARRAFKVSLLGDESLEGKTASEILSVALRRANSGVGAKSLGLFLAGFLSLAILLPTSFGEAGDSMQVSIQEQEGFAFSDSERAPQDIVASPPLNERLTPQVSGSLESEVSNFQSVGLFTQESSGAEVASGVEKSTLRDAGSARIEEEARELREAFSERLESGLLSTGENFGAQVMNQDLLYNDVSASTELEILLPSGVAVAFLIDLDSQSPVEHMQFTANVGNNQIVGFAQQGMAVIEQREGSSTLHYVAADFLVGDFGGAFDFLSVELGGTNNLIFELEIEFPNDGGNLRIIKAEFRASAVPAS